MNPKTVQRTPMRDPKMLPNRYQSAFERSEKGHVSNHYFYASKRAYSQKAGILRSGLKTSSDQVRAHPPKYCAAAGKRPSAEGSSQNSCFPAAGLDYLNSKLARKKVPNMSSPKHYSSAARASGSRQTSVLTVLFERTFPAARAHLAAGRGPKRARLFCDQICRVLSSRRQSAFRTPPRTIATHFNRS